jgi:hypothetical protein
MGIKASGYLAYDSFIEGLDHRWLWLDITFKTAFRHNMHAMQRPQTRPLHCKDPRIVSSYAKLYEKLASKHNLCEKVSKLESESSYPLTQAPAGSLRTIG